MRSIQAALLLALIALLPGCSTMQQAEVALPAPILKIEDFFDGETYAWGLFTDRFGKVRRQFNVYIEGSFEAGLLTLDEHFCYADGERDRRLWRIRPVADSRYLGEADDVDGQAVGERYGNSLHWRYRVDLKMGQSKLNAEVRKFGLKLGEVALFFSKGKPSSPWDGLCT